MGHGNTAPHVPETVHDEAGDSPKWLPGLGIALFALFVGWVVLSHATSGEDSAEPAAEQAP